MRTFVLTVAIVFGLLMLPVAAAGTERATPVVNGTVLLAAHALEAQEKPIINIEINKDGGSNAWYANPVWMAIGGLGALVVIVLVVMAAKGGGTTIVKG